ncbi:MAG: beta strand repeat-containing protein, partial [Limisphaerales bacterium]
ASGGIGPYNFAVTDGTLPNGLTLSSGGVLSATPQTAGAFTFTVTATDANGCSGSQTYNLTITCPTITLSSSTLPNGTEGIAYSQMVNVIGGVGPYAYAVTGGSLPNGLMIDASTGAISGIPAAIGNFTFTVTATDNHGCAGSGVLTISIPTACSLLVSTTADSGAGSLRDAMTCANNLPGPDVISVSVRGTINLLSPLPDLTDDVTINGPSSYLLTVRRSDGGNYSIFSIRGTSELVVNISGMQITNGFAVPSGGGIYQANGKLNLTDMQITANQAHTGAGIFTEQGTLTIANSFIELNTSSFSGFPVGAGINNHNGSVFITNSTITSNVGGGEGGGAYNSGTMQITNSLFLENTAHNGGGLYNGASGVLTIVNSTVNHNGAGESGAGIQNDGLLTIANCTLTRNHTNTDGGGVYRTGGTVNLINNIIAGNTAPMGPDVAGETNGQGNGWGHNLVGNGSGSIGLTNGVAGNQIGTAIGPIDPHIDPLGAYGGATSTNRLESDSPALDAGDDCVAQNPGCLVTPLTTDQRGTGFARKFGAHVDIGAYESTCFPITVSPSNLPNGTVGVAYNQIITPSSGTAPYSLSVNSGSLPTGLLFNSTTGSISGAPTVAGTFTFTVTATDANGCMGSQNYTVAINCPQITLLPSMLPNGVVGNIYGQTITASSGTGSYSFAVTSGTLPTGLALSLAGVLSGTPTAAGNFTFAVTATDANNCTGSQTVTININKATPTITWANPADINYGTALSATQLNATANVGGTFAFTPVAGTVLNAGNGQTLLVTFMPTDTTNYDNANKSVSINVNKASLTIKTNNASKTFGDAPVTFTVSYTGLVNGDTPASLGGALAFDVSDTAATAAGSYTVSPTGLTSSNYQISFAGGTFTVNKALSSVTVNCPPSETYMGSALTPCTASYSGPGGLAGSLTPTYSDNINVGTATASANYAGDANHDGSNGSANFAITKASSSVTVACPPSQTYSGAPITPCSASYSGAGGLSGTLMPTYLNNVNVGEATASASYAGDANHDGSNNTAAFAITKAASLVTVLCSTSETYTGAAIEPCTASYSGAGGLTGTLTPTYADNMNVGTATASASFSGDANHDGSSNTSNFAITKATSTATVTVSDATYDGNAHDGTASVAGAGTLNQSLTVSYGGRNGTSYGPSDTAPTDAGDYTASAAFAGDDNHSASSDSKDFTINKAASTTTVVCTAGPFTYNGSP